MWNGRRKSIRFMRFVVSTFLILCMVMGWTLKNYGPLVAQAVEETNTTYVSDVRLFYALDSVDAARSKCVSSGFIPVEGDLNAGTDKNHVVMGYKETSDKEEAITSIKLLSMDSGYQLKDYAALQKEYESSNSAIIDTIEAASLEFVANYMAGSPKAKEAYQGLNLIYVPEAGDVKLGDYIVSGKADWNFFARVVTRASSGTTSAIVSYLSSGLAAYENEYDSNTESVISVSWADLVKDSMVWEELEDANTEDDYDELYREYGDDARAFHKKLQEFAAAYDNAMLNYDEEKYASELENLKGKSDEDVLDNQENLSQNEQGMVYIGIYDELDKHNANEDDTLAEYLLNIGYETTEDVDLTKLYPVLDSMTYAQRRIAAFGGLTALISTVGENEASMESTEKISEAAENIKKLIGRDSYSIWMNNNEEIKGKKVAYTSDAVRKNAAQQLLDDYDNSTVGEKVEDVMKWVNLALGMVSCILVITQFTWVTYVLAAIPAAICAIASACGLTCCATTIAAIAGKIGALSSAAGPAGWIVLAVLIVSMLVVWAVSEIEKYIKENKDSEYEDAPEYVADCAEGEHGEYLTYYKGTGSELQTSSKYVGKTGSDSEENKEGYHGSAGISDVNGRMGFRGWNLMFYSKDTNVGTPIVIQDGKSPFLIKYGDGGSLIKGYESVNSFGEITPANCNSLMKKDEKGGVFVHYRTEKSILNDQNSSEETAQATKSNSGNKKVYYADIIVKSADTEARAKAKIITKKGFKVWDYNLANNARKDYSRHQEWAYTYLGFKTTEDPNKAITDIRVATFTPMSTQEVNFGEVKYACAGNLGYKADSKTEDKDYPEDLDGLWYTTSDKAGTPIEFGALHVVSDHADGKYVNEGWVPVTTFSGVPYNFASTRDSDTDDWEPGRLGNAGYRYTCYQSSKDNSWDCPARYLYYEPEVKYTSGTKYLSAVFFTFGTDSESTAAKVGETEAKYSQLTDRMKKTPNTVVIEGNLASSFVYKGYVVESNQKYLNLGYSWSYNPYRALSDIKVFQGTIFTTELPYNISKPVQNGGSEGNANRGYVAATVVSQRTTTRCAWVTRGIGPENAYMSPNGLLGTNTQVPTGYTSYKPGGYSYSQDNMPFIASGLYVSGADGGAQKLTLDDIIISSKEHVAQNDKGVISTQMSGEKTLSGLDATGDFNSIQEMKKPYETRPFNIAYPEWTNDDGDHYDAASPCYIYIRKPALKKKYISRVFVGSFSFDKANVDEDYDANQSVARQVDLRALLDSNTQSPDEVIPANVALVPGRTWYGTQIRSSNEFDGRDLIDTAGGWYETKDFKTKRDVNRLPWGPPFYELKEDGEHRTAKYSADYVNRPAAYISVERTDDPNDAIKGLLLYKTKVDTVPQKIQVDGVDYYCASTSNPIDVSAMDCEDNSSRVSFKWTEDRYFLYYTNNQGVAPGQPFTDIIIDENVFNSKQATCLCIDKVDKTEYSKDGRKTVKEIAKPYGESNLPVFIHASYEKNDNSYYNKVYTANGKTKKEALSQLLEQGCTEFLDMNLNEGASLTDRDKSYDSKKKGGDYIYFGYRGYTLNEKEISDQPTADAKKEEMEEQLLEAVYDIVCTVGEKYHPEGIQTERYSMYYMPVVKLNKDDDLSGTDLNAGTNGPPIYMYYTTTDAVNDFNKKTGSDVRKNPSPQPKEYFKSPISKFCFTRYDRVPYNQDAGAASDFGDNKKPWEYVLYNDSETPVDFNDGTVKLDKDFLTENNHISMFVQRKDGSVKKSAEITGGYTSEKTDVGEMWLNK